MSNTNKNSIGHLILATALATLCTSSSAHAMFASLKEWRCTDRDPMPGGVQNQAENAALKGRLLWTKKCYPFEFDFINLKLDPSQNILVFENGGSDIAYPVFGYWNSDNTPTILHAPVDENDSCDALQKLAPDVKRITIVGYCGLGCLTPDQVVEFGEGAYTIGSKEADNQKTLMTLSDDLLSKSLSFKATPLVQIVTDIEAKKQTILEFTTEDGAQIKTTVNHPLMTAEGYLQRADKLKIGSEIVHADGHPAKIINVKSLNYFGKVYNVKPDSGKIEENVYIANGFLNGSVHVQNHEVDYLNRLVLRHGLGLDMN